MSIFLKIYFLLLPFQWALSPVAGVDMAVVRPITLVLGLFWLARGCIRKEIRLPIGTGFFFFCSFLLVVSLSFFWSANPLFSVRKILFLLSFAPLFLVLLDFFQNANDRNLVLRSYVLGAIAAAAVGIFLFFAQFLIDLESLITFVTARLLPIFLGPTFGQTVQQYPSLLVNIGGNTWLRASGVFPDPHMFAFYIGMAIPVALAFYYMAPQVQKWKWLVAIGILLLADLLTFSRGAYTGLLCTSLLWFVASDWKKSLKLKKGVRVGIGLIFFLGFLLLTPFPGRFYSSFSQYDGSNVERLRLWHEAAEHIVKHPVLGVGIGNYPLIVKPTATYREPIYVHNLYLDIAVEVGFFGLILFLILLAEALGRSWNRWRRESDVFSYGIVLSLVIFSTHSLFETPLYSVHVLPVFLLFLAAGVTRFRAKKI